MPIDRPSLFTRAKELLRLGRPREALAEYTRAAGNVPPDVSALIALAARELNASRIGEGQTALMRLVTAAPDHAGAVAALARDLRASRPEAAFACIEVLADTALLEGDFDRAAALLSEFLEGGPWTPALAKLFDVHVDAGSEDAAHDAQVTLVDVYLSEGRAVEARPLAEDLLAREPDSDAHAERLRRALLALGVDDVDLVVSLVRSVPPAASLSVVESDAEDIGDLIGRPVEIDLSPQVDGLSELPLPGAASSLPPPDLEDVFADMRGLASSAEPEDAAVRFAAGIEHLQMGRVVDGVRDLEAAAANPRYRFECASRLGRIRLGQGDAAAGVEWLQRAAEAPAPTPEEGLAVLYELAEALERTGDDARALAVLAEVEAGRSGYRDVAERMRILQTRVGDVR